MALALDVCVPLIVAELVSANDVLNVINTV